MFGAWVVIDMGVDQKHLPLGQQQAVHAGIGFDARSQADDLVDVLQVQAGGAPGAANQAVCVAFVHQHGSDQGKTPAHFNFCDLNGDAPALCHRMVILPKIAVTMVVFNVHDIVVVSWAQAQAKLLYPNGNHRRAANQGGAGQPLVDYDLRSTQHPLLLTLGIGDSVFQAFFGGRINRLHHGARGIDKALQALSVGVHVGNRAQRHAAVGCGLGHRWRDFHHQARIEWLGNQVLGAKSQVFAGIGCGHHLVLLGLREFGNGANSSDFHFGADG